MSKLRIIYHDGQPTIWVELSGDFTVNRNAEDDLADSLMQEGLLSDLEVEELDWGYLIKAKAPKPIKRKAGK